MIRWSATPNTEGWKLGSILAGCLLASVAACAPVKLSSECQARISDCLKNCKIDGARVDESGLGNDGRTLCEKNCHQLCN